jgi:hypothetical protein
VVKAPGKREIVEHAASLRAQGLSWVAIAEDVCARYALTPRAALRQIRGWSQREVSDRWNQRWPDEPKSDKVISYWERWPGPTGHEPPIRMLARLAQLYECGVGDLITDLPGHWHLDPHHKPTIAQGDSAPERHEPTMTPPPESFDQGDDMERRQLLQWAIAGIGAGTLGVSGEPVRQLLSHTFAVDDRSLEEWQIALADHLHALNTRPAAQVSDGLVVDLFAANRQIQRTTNTVVVTELQRVVARLSAMQADALSRLAEHPAAIRWWRTARTAAEAAGDRTLSLTILGREAVKGVYGQRDPQAVLAMVDRALETAGPRPSPGVAHLTSAKARALAVLGRHSEACRTLNTLTDVSGRFDQLDFWEPGDSYFAESWVYAAAGDESATARASDNLLRLPNTGWGFVTNTQLHRAICTVLNGGIREGAEHAVAVLERVPAQFRTNEIAQTARRVIDAAPNDERGRPAIENLRHAIAAR